MTRRFPCFTGQALSCRYTDRQEFSTRGQESSTSACRDIQVAVIMYTAEVARTSLKEVEP